MPGGLLNLISVGHKNIILNGNPTKSFFRSTYMKYTNFGLQKFRISHEGLRNLDTINDTQYTFKIPRYGDLLMDTFLVLSLPHIWSSVYKKTRVDDENNTTYTYIPYEFKWIEELGTQIIKNIKIRCGNSTLQEYSGEYISVSAKRDYKKEELEKFNAMIGNTSSLTNPLHPSVNGLNGYPSAFFDITSLSGGGPEPSIRGRKLYVPLNAWFCNTSKQCFPLISTQNNEVYIDIAIRPLKEMFVIRDVSNSYSNKLDSISYINTVYNEDSVINNDLREKLIEENNVNREDYSNLEFINHYPHVQPNFNLPEHAMFRFLHPPPNTELNYTNADQRILFNSDIHLIGTYAFLTEEEGHELALKEQSYLIKDVREYIFKDIVGNKKIALESSGLVTNWTFFLRRNDAFLRNQWNNYSNWPYKERKPQRIIPSDIIRDYYESPAMLYDTTQIGRSLFDYNTSVDGDRFVKPPISYYSSGPFNVQNENKILKRIGITLDGKIREETFDSGIYNYIEPFQRAGGTYNDNLYFYNFGIETARGSTQPCGAINLSKFSKIELELETELPPLDPDAHFFTICSSLEDTQDNDANSGRQILGVNKETFRLYKYTYDLRFFEEKYNIVNFSSGMCGLMFTR